MKLNGAQIVVECLKEQGVKHIFGYPGAATINIYDELYKNEEHISHILTSHEQGATHAADGYARSTGNVGVCLATSGPGATNLVTGIATAYMDSVPMVAITGNVQVDKLGKDSFQEVDIQGITMPITKHNYMVKDINKLVDTIRDAFYIAKSGRPGPVLIDIPKNLTWEEADYEYMEPKTYTPSQEFKISNEIFEMIAESKRPMILAGGGVIRSHAAVELKAFAEKIDAQVACTLMGIGAMPFSHPLYTGNIGMHGSLVSNQAINETDLLIVMGGRFSDRVVGKESGFAAKAKLIHIDIDPAEINKNVVVDGAVNGDIKAVLSELIEKVDAKENKPWKIFVDHLRETVGHRTDDSCLNVPYLLKRISEYATDDTIVATDVGQHQMWTAQHFPFEKPNRFLTSGGLGTMGYGFGAAIGAQFANPDEKVIMITGDGSFRMNFNEMITAVKNRLPVKVFVMNNRALGMVRQWQNLFYDKRFSATTLEEDMDYVGFARALGGEGFNILHLSDIDEVLPQVFESKKPCIINCVVDQNTNVYPMVPPGKSIYEAISDGE